MTSYTVFARATLAHWLRLSDATARRMNVGEFTGISTHPTLEAAESWLAKYRGDYSEFDEWSIDRNPEPTCPE